MTSEKIHNIAKAFFYTWLLLAAITAVWALINIISRYVLPEAIGFTFTFCWLWFMSYLFVDARAKHKRLSIRTDGKIGD